MIALVDVQGIDAGEISGTRVCNLECPTDLSGNTIAFGPDGRYRRLVR